MEDLLVELARKNYPELGQRTDGEVMQLYRDGKIDIQDVNVDDVNMTYAQDDFNVEPPYRIRDQLKRDFLEGGLFRDAKQSLGETKDAFLEDIGGVTKGLGSLAGYVKDKGIDFGKMAMRGIGNMIMPGLGFVLGALPKDSAANKFNRSFTVGGSNMPNDPYGYYNDLRAGNLNQDPFGRNPVSMFGNYTGTLAKDANYTGTNKFNLAKKDFAENYFDKNAINAGGVKIDNTVYSGADYQGDGGGGGFDRASHNAGKASAAAQEQSNRDYARGKFSQGGIASL